MLPAQPPHSRRISLIWKETESTCVWSGRIWRANRSGKTMIVSSASEPQIRVRGALIESARGGWIRSAREALRSGGEARYAAVADEPCVRAAPALRERAA